MSATFWIKAAELITSLSLLVFVHELGHYMWARIFGIKVEKFYLFFNPWFTILKWHPRSGKVSFFSRNPKEEKEEGEKKENPQVEKIFQDEDIKEEPSEKQSWRDTEYGLGWLPLGGYCSIAGMIDETKDASDLAEEPQPWEFRSKPAWKRLLVMVGGVLNNFIFAILIYAGMVYYWGEDVLPFKNITMGMNFSETAQKAGFVNGDIVVEADGKELAYDMINDGTQKLANAKQVKVLRDGKEVTIKLPEHFFEQITEDAKNGDYFMEPRFPVVVEKTMGGEGAEKAGMQQGDSIVGVNGEPAPDLFSFTKILEANKDKTVSIAIYRDNKPVDVDVHVNADGKIGINLRPVNEFYNLKHLEFGLWESIPHGTELGWNQLYNYVAQLKYLFTKTGAESLGGFGTIGSIFPDTWDWYGFWKITALISIILAFMNILPIPALDGGHVLFLLYEIIFRRRPSDKFLERAQMVGLTILLLLLIYANGNDIWRWVIKPFMN
ncbi:MAG: RIP metalloprotease RseP [Muribaculaceae bacterium]|nr:RIP metalloprotease RseP [Muribaculaceae bacterium]